MYKNSVRSMSERVFITFVYRYYLDKSIKFNYNDVFFYNP